MINGRLVRIRTEVQNTRLTHADRSHARRNSPEVR
jgi:hypothetical protein